MNKKITEDEKEIAKGKENKTKGKISSKEIVIEGNYDEAMEQLESADLPEEVKALAKAEIRKHFNK